MSQQELPLEQTTRFHQLKKEIAIMLEDQNQYEQLHAKIMRNHSYYLSNLKRSLAGECLHINVTNKDSFDYHNHIYYTRTVCVDCGKVIKSV